MEGYFAKLMPEVLDEGSAARFERLMARNVPTDEAIRFIERQRVGGIPFAITFQLMNTHRPWAMRDHPYFRVRAMEEFGLDAPPADDVAGARWTAIHEPDNLAYIRRLGLAYADRTVASIMASIERAGLRDSTVVLIYSNHGEVFDHFRHVHALKMTCVSHGSIMAYDALEHTFQIWQVPGVPPAWHRNRVRVVDIVPTVCQLLGISPGSCDGRSIQPLFENPATEGDDSRESLCLSPQAYSFRSGEFKLYHCCNNDSYHRNAIFDTSWDRAERHDVLSSPSHRHIRDRLAQRLREILTGKASLA
jgi:hypothetical protein